MGGGGARRAAAEQTAPRRTCVAIRVTYSSWNHRVDGSCTCQRAWSVPIAQSS